jgi:hypothetical protein
LKLRAATGLVVLGAMGLAACGGGGGAASGGSGGAGSGPVAQPPAPPSAPKQFVDVTAGSGIAYYIGYSFVQLDPTLARIATGGAASGDYDGDGDIDLFITRGDIGPNLLFRNDGTGVFTDVAAAAGVDFTATATQSYRHSGPAFADFDGDGDLDLFVGGLFNDPSILFRNDGAGADYRFTDVTAGSGIDQLTRPHNISAAFGDYDLDGDADLFVTHWGTGFPGGTPGDTQHLWRNDSSGGVIRFTSVSEAAGISPSIITLHDPKSVRAGIDWTFAASFARIDDDLYPDIVVAADFNTSQVFLNQGDGTFRNATDVNVIIDYNGMGSALGDYDADGDLDWFVSAIGAGNGVPMGDVGTLGNRLYRNTLGEPTATGVFKDVTDQTGVADGGWGWGACFLDLENDGDLDIYHTNGWSGVFADDRSRAFVADDTGIFQERATDLGLNDEAEGRGIVCADFDNDGDTDILQLHRGYPLSATMWRNDTSGNNFLRVQLEGRAPNTEASGARIHATIGSRTQMREIIIGNNFVSQNPTLQLFGLGTSTQVDALRVEWPDGTETTLGPVAAGQTLKIRQAAP